MAANPLQAVARWPTGYRLLMRRRGLIARSERVVRGVSGGRFGVLDLVGLPSVLVTIPGRTSGVSRTTTLQYVPDGNAFLLVGSNWGDKKHPAWSANLMAAMQVAVRRRNERFDATVRLLTGAEREQAWDKALAFWPNYRIAAEMAGGREFRLFRLERI